MVWELHAATISGYLAQMVERPRGCPLRRTRFRGVASTMYAALLSLGAGACEPNSGGEATTRTTSTAAAIESSVRNESRAPAPSASSSASAPIAVSSSGHGSSPAHALAGTWRGTFEAKKAKVTVDPGVSEPSFKKDKGTVATGPGKLEIVVAPDGTVSGHTEGALGRASVSGVCDEASLTASFHPTEEEGPRMAGTIVLSHTDGRLSGTLSASSADATLARAATLELARD